MKLAHSTVARMLRGGREEVILAVSMVALVALAYNVHTDWTAVLNAQQTHDVAELEAASWLRQASDCNEALHNLQVHDC